MTDPMQPLFDALGAHRGLNADWSCQAWLVGHDKNGEEVWILDQEEWHESRDRCLVTIRHTYDGEDGEQQYTDLADGVLPLDALRIAREHVVAKVSQ